MILQWPEIDGSRRFREFHGGRGPALCARSRAGALSVVLHGTCCRSGRASDRLRLFARLRSPQCVRARRGSRSLCWTGVGGRTRTTRCLCLTPKRRSPTSWRACAPCRSFSSGRSFENVSSYSPIAIRRFPSGCAWRRSRDAPCFLLLDVNNVYVSAFQSPVRPARISARNAQTAWCSFIWQGTDNGFPSRHPRPPDRRSGCGSLPRSRPPVRGARP